MKKVPFVLESSSPSSEWSGRSTGWDAGPKIYPRARFDHDHVLRPDSTVHEYVARDPDAASRIWGFVGQRTAGPVTDGVTVFCLDIQGSPNLLVGAVPYAGGLEIRAQTQPILLSPNRARLLIECRGELPADLRFDLLLEQLHSCILDARR